MASIFNIASYYLTKEWFFRKKLGTTFAYRNLIMSTKRNIEDALKTLEEVRTLSFSLDYKTQVLAKQQERVEQIANLLKGLNHLNTEYQERSDNLNKDINMMQSLMDFKK